MPASSSSYRRRSGAPRTDRTFWARPRLSWSLFLDLISLNASGCCQKDVISLDSCKHFGRGSVGRGSASASVAVSSCCRHRRTLQQTLAVGLPRLPMSRVLDPKLRLPLMLEHVLLVLTGPEWRRGLAGWMGMVRTHRLGGGAPCFRCSFRLLPREQRLALAEASASAISLLRNHKGHFRLWTGRPPFLPICPALWALQICCQCKAQPYPSQAVGGAQAKMALCFAFRIAPLCIFDHSLYHASV